MGPPSSGRPAMKRVMDILKSTDGVAHISITPGNSIIDGAGPTMGCGFASLEPWEERLKRGRSKAVIMAELVEKFSAIQDGIVFPFSLPPITGLGQSSGSEMWLEDKAGLGAPRLGQVADDMVEDSASDRRLATVRATFRPNAPTILADVDRTKALVLKVPLQSLFDTMQTYLGSTYVNDFNEFGRTWHVMIQGDAKFRTRTEDIKRLDVRNLDGKMVPVGTLIKINETSSPLRIDRYNMYPAIRLSARVGPGSARGRRFKPWKTWQRSICLLAPGTSGPVWHISRRRSAVRFTWSL